VPQCGEEIPQHGEIKAFYRNVQQNTFRYLMATKSHRVLWFHTYTAFRIHTCSRSCVYYNAYLLTGVTLELRVTSLIKEIHLSFWKPECS